MAAPIRKIHLQLWTSSREDSGGQGRAYLAVSGREFVIHRDGIANLRFNPGGGPTDYIFGEGSNVSRPQDNDPRSPWQIDALELPKRPCYIRYAPRGDDENWDVERADVTVTFQSTAPGENVVQTIDFTRLGSGPHLWLGTQRGLYLYFAPTNL